ncbi:hypothetical protein STRDD10_00500 [Streptococcus sp. DD10]|uniref:hypothetical protein n=1 Tax=Streptococcus sp. DD10 TaxID=1777878 RepID=UPI000798EBFC|nr:hypothetical protein [Streptococcus sp. DD10]KXT75092.1 hypothetical protein STRDD10_00500 [Streptococcus sp. DD10]
MSFDLAKKQLFGADVAIKDGNLYGDELVDWSLEDYYENEEDYFLDATRHIPIDKKAIKENQFKQTIVLQDIWSHFKSEDVTNDVIENFKQGNLTQLRISYNKNYLPIKLEGFYKSGEEKGWKDLFYIDYPYENQSMFDKELDAYVKTIESQTTQESEVEDD